MTKKVVKASELTPEQAASYLDSEKRADRLANAMVSLITSRGSEGGTKPDGMIDCAAVQHALTIVTAFFLKQTMDSMAGEGTPVGMESQPDELVADVLNNIRMLAYGTGRVSMPFYAIGPGAFDA